jgi:uncharacterized phage-associated protein
MVAPAPYDARAVANLLLDFAEQRGAGLTQLQLYKILYFAHGWHLVETGQPLVSQEFEAWQLGPVIKVLRDEFKEYGNQEIKRRASKLDIYTGNRTCVSPDIVESDRKFIQNIYLSYHIYDAWKLSDMTHEKGSPWDQLWHTQRPIGRLALRIRNEDIKAHFCCLPQRLQVS